ncbi:MAG: hypothetical protein JW839_11290 [Candidatus Lokiarchaeota archaeon]|nr:hypothetical protein [Candidatus Lokiarchaeota archaeon]
MPIKVAFMQGSSCWGCHQSLLNLHLGLVPVLPELDIVYWPAVVDFKLSSLEARPDKSIDVGFYEGMLRTEHDVHNAKTMRAKCKLLIAFGTCACFGSVHGLANQWSREELLERKFETVESMGEPNDMVNKRDPELTPICESVVNLDRVVKIDAYMPGCPPRKENILGAVAFLIKKDPATMKRDTNVCATCKASPCLLEQGKLCWGSVTAGGCSLMCPGDNLTPCTGCFGKSDKPDAARAAKLKGMLLAKKVGPEDANLVSQFLLLYHGLPTQGSLYLAADPMRKLALGAKMEFTDDVVGASLKTLANNPNYQFSNSNVCGTCDRNGNMNKKMTQIKRNYEGVPDTGECFINQGYVCMGPMTQAGCGAICPNNGNSVCVGCYGPVFGVGEQGARGISTIASLADVDIDDIKSGILDPVGLFYRFTLAASEINKKVNDTHATGGETKQ